MKRLTDALWGAVSSGVQMRMTYMPWRYRRWSDEEQLYEEKDGRREDRTDA